MSDQEELRVGVKPLEDGSGRWFWVIVGFDVAKGQIAKTIDTEETFATEAEAKMAGERSLQLLARNGGRYRNGSAQSKHGETYFYEVTWNDGPNVTWDAIVRRDGNVKGRPGGQITHTMLAAGGAGNLADRMVRKTIYDLVGIDR